MRRIRFRLVRGLKSYVDTDVDYQRTRISAKKSDVTLQIWHYGVFWGVPGASMFEAPGSVAATRAILLGEIKGYDVRVTTPTKQVSRWVGVFHTFMVYEGVDPEVAKKFDAVMDSICYY